MRDTRGDNTARNRTLPFLALGLLICCSLLLAGLVNRLVHVQEDRLLDQRATSAGAFVSSSFGSLTATLPMLGAMTQPGLGSPTLFDAVAKGITKDGGAVATAARQGDRFVAQESVGKGIAERSTLTGPRAALAARAIKSDGLVAAVRGTGDRRLLMLAVVSPTSKDVVVFAEFPFDPTPLTASSPDAPFHEINGALYVGTKADQAHLLLTTGPLPRSDTKVEEQRVEVGADHWLLVVSPKGPLVGQFAHSLPWLVLAVGLIAALLVALLLWSVTRRRVYALRLVDERTAELKTALAEQQRLEEGQRVAREAAEEGEPREERVPVADEPRAAHAAERGARLRPAARDSTTSTRTQHDSVKQILSGGRHLLDLINEVLDITRIETGTLPAVARAGARRATIVRRPARS